MPRTPKAAKTKRTRRTPERARQHILDAAVRAISKHGPASCGLKEVAAEAQISHALITHYFGTYEALVDAAVDEALKQIRERMVERMLAISNPTPETMVTLYLEIAMEPWYGRLMSWAIFNDREGSRSYAQRLAPLMKVMAIVNERLWRDHGQAFNRDQQEALLVAIWATVVGYVAADGFFWRALGRRPSPRRDQLVREVLATLTRGVMRPMTAP